MSAVKPPQSPPSSSSMFTFTVRGSLLTLAILTLTSFTFLSLKSLTSSRQTPPSSNLVVNAISKSDVGEELSEVYHSPEILRLSYEEMEQRFKFYVYPDGDPNTFYQTPRNLTGKYSSEGYFFQNIRESRFRTDDPVQADLFFIPISCHKMRGKGTSYENMSIIVKDYAERLTFKYPYWIEHWVLIAFFSLAMMLG